MLVDKINHFARRGPDKPALVYNQQELSYRAFACAIELARRWLEAQGIAADGVSGSSVAVLAIANIRDAWVLSLAVRSLGVATLVVPSLEQIVHLGLAGIGCVVTTETENWRGAGELCQAAGWRRITVPKTIFADLANTSIPVTGTTPHFGGHLLLTSGTTGRFKMVMADLAQQSDSLSVRQQVFGISDQSIVNLANFQLWGGGAHNFAIATWDAGGAVVFQQGGDVHTALNYRGITHTLATPYSLACVLSAPAGAFGRNDAMRLIVVSGPLSEAMTLAAQRRLTRQIYTYYGTTEAGVVAVTQIVHLEDIASHKILPSRQVQIVDDRDRVLPAGREGQVRIRTAHGVNRYFQDPLASQEFFRDGYFYPGDLGIVRPDGRLVLRGRVTEVINVLGVKIAAGPLEEAVQRETGATGVCIFSAPDQTGVEEVHVAVEPRRSVDRSTLSRVLSQLPVRVRARLHCVDALPRNDLGKVRRDVLRRQLGVASGEA